jgi:hypothetical protein
MLDGSRWLALDVSRCRAAARYAVQRAASTQIVARDGRVVSIAAHAGYALGLLFFIPLGDKVELRKLFALTLSASVVALVAMAAAPTLPWAVAASFI